MDVGFLSGGWGGTRAVLVAATVLFGALAFLLRRRRAHEPWVVLPTLVAAAAMEVPV